jgi:translation initiation factor IF-2
MGLDGGGWVCALVAPVGGGTAAFQPAGRRRAGGGRDARWRWGVPARWGRRGPGEWRGGRGDWGGTAVGQGGRSRCACSREPGRGPRRPERGPCRPRARAAAAAAPRPRPRRPRRPAPAPAPRPGPAPACVSAVAPLPRAPRGLPRRAEGEKPDGRPTPKILAPGPQRRRRACARPLLANAVGPVFGSSSSRCARRAGAPGREQQEGARSGGAPAGGGGAPGGSWRRPRANAGACRRRGAPGGAPRPRAGALTAPPRPPRPRAPPARRRW